MSKLQETMPQIAEKNESTLKQQIAASRARLHRLWNLHGHTSPAVLVASIELDELLNRYQREEKNLDSAD
ncbi:aspartyl-phosphate phosphatase Spo0E family protein [Hydrogenispora ethanolica]|nr:aspartyl-phosphate phosphatase Spo0E family protein [Hydrogenispora ethanolica]